MYVHAVPLMEEMTSLESMLDKYTQEAMRTMYKKPTVESVTDNVS